MTAIKKGFRKSYVDKNQTTVVNFPAGTSFEIKGKPAVPTGNEGMSKVQFAAMLFVRSHWELDKMDFQDPFQTEAPLRFYDTYILSLPAVKLVPFSTRCTVETHG